MTTAIGRALCTTAIVLCCSASAFHPAALSRGPFSLASTSGEIDAGGPNANVVDEYRARPKNPPPVAEITSGLFAPTGMTVDAAGNLYVCNNAGQAALGRGKGFWTVTVYRPHGSMPFRTYTDGVWSPVDVAVAPDGTAYVANLGSGLVTVYRPHRVHPSHALVPSSTGGPLAVALDGAGNVYVSYANRIGSGVVYRYAHGKKHGANIGVAFGGEPHGLALDAKGDLIVAVSKAPGSGSDIEVYPPGATKPTLTLTGPFQPFMLALDEPGHRLYVADYGSGNNDGGVFVYSYPDGTLLFEDNKGAAAGAYGVAFDPR